MRDAAAVAQEAQARDILRRKALVVARWLAGEADGRAADNHAFESHLFGLLSRKLTCKFLLCFSRAS